MAKFISFGHLNIDGADELHITAKHDPPVDRRDILGRLVMDPILPDSLQGQEPLVQIHQHPDLVPLPIDRDLIAMHQV